MGGYCSVYTRERKVVAIEIMGIRRSLLRIWGSFQAFDLGELLAISVREGLFWRYFGTLIPPDYINVCCMHIMIENYIIQSNLKVFLPIMIPLLFLHTIPFLSSASRFPKSIWHENCLLEI
jgi:hypothetical protein